MSGVYVARVSTDGRVRVYPIDGTPHSRPAAQFALTPWPPLRSVLAALEAGGWRPAGARGPAGRWGAISVTRADSGTEPASSSEPTAVS